jgi:hypothetical protein
MAGQKPTRHQSEPSTPQLEARWQAVKQRIESAAPFLERQGVIVAKQNGGCRVWVLRFRTREGDRRRLKSIYLCGDGEQELLDRARRLLADLRGPARWPREIAAYARFAREMTRLVRRLTGR